MVVAAARVLRERLHRANRSIFAASRTHGCESSMDSAPVHNVCKNSQVGIGARLQRAFHGGQGNSGSVIVKSVRSTFPRYHIANFTPCFPLQLHPNGPAFQSRAIDVGDAVIEIDGISQQSSRRHRRARASVHFAFPGVCAAFVDDLDLLGNAGIGANTTRASL